MSDQLLPMPDVKITEFYHQKLCFEYCGAAEMVDAMKKLTDQFPKLAGLGLALATAEAALADQRTRMLTRNLRVAMQNGFNAEEQQLAMEVRKDGIYLVAVQLPAVGE